ncbi:hypothetical protein JTB14_025230 [Gonioctena quinquepunctata]|nr:hypothetical protein JTB14_025230 [Gonioctena quinquepunctata]
MLRKEYIVNNPRQQGTEDTSYPMPTENMIPLAGTGGFHRAEGSQQDISNSQSTATVGVLQPQIVPVECTTNKPSTNPASIQKREALEVLFWKCLKGSQSASGGKKERACYEL